MPLFLTKSNNAFSIPSYEVVVLLPDISCLVPSQCLLLGIRDVFIASKISIFFTNIPTVPIQDQNDRNTVTC